MRKVTAVNGGADHLKVCWYSGDGVNQIYGKDSAYGGPSHVKYLSADNKIAIVGSGNMDSQSWNHSHEFNVLVDNASK